MTQSNSENSSFLPLALAGCVVVGGLCFAVAAGVGVVVMAGAGVAAGVFSRREQEVAAYEQQIAMDEARLAAEAEERMGMEEARRNAEGQDAAAPEPLGTGRVKLVSDGVVTAVLVSGDQRYPLPADVPAGSYSIEASFPEIQRVKAGTVRVDEGREVTIRCSTAFLTCIAG